MQLIKKYFIFVLFIVLAVSLVGCTVDPSGDNNPSGENKVDDSDIFQVPTGGYDGSEVSITFYTTMGKTLAPYLESAIVDFNELFPNIIITHQSIGGYDDVRSQISEQIPAHNEPNLAYCYPDHVAAYNAAGVVTILDNLIDSKEVVTHDDGTTEILGLTDEQKADFIKGYYDEGKAYGNDHMYTLPFSKSTEVLYYNKTFFDEHELSLPTTWEELEQLCIRIKEIDPNCIPLGYDSEANWFITMCEQYGYPYTSAVGSHYLFNTPENRAFVKYFRSWYTRGLLTTQKIHKSYTSSLFVESDPSKTRSYMSIGSSAGATNQRPAAVDGVYPFEVGITTIPQVNPDKPKVISQGPSVCIFNKTNPQEVIASWLFLKYLTTSVSFQASFSLASGYVPVINSVLSNEIYATHLANGNGYENIATYSVRVCMEQQNAYFVSPAFNGSSLARDQVGLIMQNCFVGSWGDSEVDAKIQEQFEDAIIQCEFLN